MAHRRTYGVCMRTLGTSAALALMVAGHAYAGPSGVSVPVPQEKPALLMPVSVPDSQVKAPQPEMKPSYDLVYTLLSASEQDIAESENVNYPLAAAGTPVPGKKPVLFEPDATRLLAFGEPPVPRKRPMPDENSAPMSARDIALYRKIFTEQARGNWQEADQAYNQLHDMRLRGHILYQRYMHPTAYHSDFEELDGWLALYGDHPGARHIYKMAVARKPAGYSGKIQAPEQTGKINIRMDVMFDRGKNYVSPKKRSQDQKKAIQSLDREIGRDISRGALNAAVQRLRTDERAAFLDSVEYDMQLARIAAAYFYAGRDDMALKLAQEGARRSRDKAPMAGWIGGLSAWKSGNYDTAASLFTMTATSRYTSPWMASAGAYWASRAYTRTGRIREVSYWLQKASEQPRTFYGLIATRALGRDYDFNWDMPELTQAHKNRLMRIPGGARAMALVEVGQYHLAEDELRQINPGNDTVLRDALLAYADQAGLSSLSMRLASAFPHPKGGYYDSALYPLLSWTPASGYSVDQALILALVRQESKFDPQAENSSGATGLMQLMPATARYVAGKKLMGGLEGRHRLKDPQFNLDIGQKYIETLLEQGAVNYDLFSLSVAYNAGPGNLRRWKNAMGRVDDPLLFVESIPVGETRNFVERVMSNYWIYRIRMGHPIPSLDAVTQGDWARYVSMDSNPTYKLATIR